MREVQQRLAEQLKALERELRVELPREIKTAVAMGDLSENAEYKAALERQQYVKARITALRERLSELGTMKLDRVPKDRVGLGSTIVLLDLDRDAEVTYELVIPEVSDSEAGLISIASPIAQGLLGRKEGDQVTIPVPSGRKRFEIVELKTLHDKKESEPAPGSADPA
ncbi:MAG: GreA/GreB family elongation factor [Acidobacteriia bacterium]|nr:GreA/GreB family elongation factor [Terriglobia bacterium]